MKPIPRCAVLVLLAAIILPRVAAAETLRIFGAGSLGGVFTEMIKAFPAPPGTVITPVFGPSGLLRQRIEKGEAVDILASADMTAPRALAKDGQVVILFTRNRMCALGRASLGLAADNLLDRMLDPKVRVATSTPVNDPGGDYAWAIFARADAVHPGARAMLEAKALKLVGGPDVPPPLPGHGPVESVFLADRGDMMLGYCSGSAGAMSDVPDLVSVPMPPALEVGPQFGMVVLSDSVPAARFALFVMSEQGQGILQRYGFEPVGVAEGR